MYVYTFSYCMLHDNIINYFLKIFFLTPAPLPDVRWLKCIVVSKQREGIHSCIFSDFLKSIDFKEREKESERALFHFFMH